MKKLEIKKAASEILWWMGVASLFLVSQLRVESLLYQFRQGYLRFLLLGAPSDITDTLILLNYVSPVRGILLLAGLVLVVSPVVKGIYSNYSGRELKIPPFIFFQSIVLFGVLLLVYRSYGISGLAEEYANTSLVMFSRQSSVSYHNRILMPLLANLLFFRGDFFYLVFAMFSAFVLVYLVRLWFYNNQIEVSFWQLFSLGTLSFIYFQIHIPGYPDVLVAIFILLIFAYELDQKARLSLFVLSLMSHEASGFIWFALAFTLLDLRGGLKFFAISALYVFLFLSVNLDVSDALLNRSVGGTSSIMWVFMNLDRELLGVFFGFKALWGVVIAAIAYLYIDKNFFGIAQILLIIAGGIAMTFFGVDTSRLFGWAFMAVLLSWKILAQAGGKWRLALNVFLAVNIVIPSVNVYLIMAPVISPGLYADIVGLLLR